MMRSRGFTRWALCLAALLTGGAIAVVAVAAPEATLLAARLALAAVLVFAGAAKVLELEGFRRALPALGVPHAAVGSVAVAVPLAELALAVMLVPVATAPAAAVGVTALLLVVSAALARAALTGAVEDCACFGALGALRPRWALARNAGLIGLAALVALTTPPVVTPAAGVVVAVAALVAALAATFASSALAARTVKVGDDYFVRKGDPPRVTVSKGTRVTWRWVGRDFHNLAVTRGPVKFRSAYKDSGTYSRKMRRRGTYRIVCTVHQPDMRMTLRVR